MKRPQFSIAGFMLFVLVIAVGIASAKTQSPELLFWFWFGLGVPLFILHWLWFISLPKRVKKFARGDPKRAHKILRRVVATPSLFGGQIKILARYLLLCHDQREGQFDDAVTHCRSILKFKLKPGLEADIRQHLADCLESLNRSNEAVEERRRAESCLQRRSLDYLGHMNRGKLLDRERRYPEACQAYEHGLSLVPARRSAVRVEFMLRLMLANFNAGRPDETVRYAEDAIARRPNGDNLLIAHRMAGVAYGNLGQLEEAERHRRRAHELAVETGGPHRISECLAQLADVQMRRGQLIEADETCVKAIALGTEPSRNALVTRAELFRHWGRYDEAIDLLLQASRCKALVIPADERRMQGILALELALVEGARGRVEPAWSHLQDAAREFELDPKLAVVCTAGKAWLLALRGDHEEAARISEQAEEAVHAYEQDRTMHSGTFAILGKAALAMHDVEAGERLWEHFLALNPPPVSKPTGFYYLGESRRQRGDEAAALDAYRKAASLGIDTHHARLATRRLSEAKVGDESRST